MTADAHCRVGKVKRKSGAIISLVEKIGQPNSQCVEALEIMLAKAKAGEITQVCIAATCREGFTHTNYAAGENIGLLIGAAEYVKYRLLVHQDES